MKIYAKIMKNITTFLFLISAMCISAFTQSLSYELDKIREIKMLESTRGDVRRILAGYKSDDEYDESDSETFSSEKMNVEVSYTTGDCSDDSDDMDEWNVAKGKIKSIKISFDDIDDYFNFEDFQYDISSLQKEQRYADIEDYFVYHDKDKGIAFFVNEKGIDKIWIFPVSKQSSLLCKNEEAEKLKEFYSTKSYFGNVPLEDRFPHRGNITANVTELTLSEYEIAVSCPAVDPAKPKNCSISPLIISVSTTANDPEGDTLIYLYTVSGGRIVGEGKDVIWDLADVKPGKYTITAGVDDGCGVCGETKTQTVEVK